MYKGSGGWSLYHIFQYKDHAKAKERIKGDRDGGKYYKDELRAIKCFSGGKL